MVIALWNLLPEVAADAGTVDENLVKTFDRKICGRVLPKEFMESLCDSPAENSWCGKAPRGSMLTLFLFFLGQLLLIRAVGRELGWVGLGGSWGLPGRNAAATCCANLGSSTRAQLAPAEPPRGAAAAAPAPRELIQGWHPPAWAGIPAVITGCAQLRAGWYKILLFLTAICCLGIPTQQAWSCTNYFGGVYK